MDLAPANREGAEAVDGALEELRHATFGFFGPALRERFQAELGWVWSATHYRLLRAIEATYPLRPTITELAGTLLTDKARASRLVSELQHLGLVRRVPGRLDRRRREVEVTDEGAAALAEARRVRSRFISAVLADWSQADIEAFGALLDRFNTAVRDRGP